jgi:hypothetical protein
MTRAMSVPAELAEVPFATTRALALGLTPSALHGQRFRRLFDGVHVTATTPMTLQLWIAAARLVVPPDAVVSHLTRLRLLGIGVGPRWPLRFESAHSLRVRRDRIHVARVAALPPARAGLASPEHCFAVACADLDLVDAVIVGDQLLHLGLATVESLSAAVRRRRGRGVRTARRALALVREGSESPRETLLRLMLVLAGLPEPECNVNVGTDEAFIGRGDLVYLAYRLVVEYDGRQHADVRYQWLRDLDRHDAFDLSRWRTVRVTAERLRSPRTVVAGIHAKLVAQGYRGPAPAFTDEWRELFEQTTAARRSAVALAGSWA